MKDEELVVEVLARLHPSLNTLSAQLAAASDRLATCEETGPRRILGKLEAPLNRALQDVSAALAGSAAWHDLKCGGTQSEVDPDQDPVKILLVVDHWVSQLLVEIGFSLTLTAGMLPRPLHQTLSDLLSACETARHDLDESVCDAPNNGAAE